MTSLLLGVLSTTGAALLHEEASSLQVQQEATHDAAAGHVCGGLD
jgi:hypothetical protein